MGINTKNNDAAQEVANAFGAAFNFAAKDGNSSVFSSTGIEVMKSQYLGKQGHLAVRTNQIDIAIADLEGFPGRHGDRQVQGRSDDCGLFEE